MDAPIPTSAARRDNGALVRMRHVGRGAALSAVVIGAAVLARWALGAEGARVGGPAFQVQPAAAAGLVVAGVAALLAGRTGTGAASAARTLALLAAGLGVLALVLHHVGSGLLAPGGPVASAGPAGLGRVAPGVALSLLLVGGAVLALTGGRGGATAGQGLALAAAALPLLALVGHAYDVRPLLGPPALSAIPLPSALALLLLDVGVLFARPGAGFVADLASPGGGGAIARRMLVYAVALPFAVGWGALAVAPAGREGASAVAVVVVALTVVLVLLALRDARALDRMEAARDRARSDREASRRELARALAREHEARAHAESASHARDELLNALSHELRTPLNAILGWTRLLGDGAGDAERLARGLAVIDRNGRLLAHLVSDLIDMSRISRGAIRIEKVEVEAAAAVEAALEVVRPAAVAKGIALRWTVAGPIPPVLGDAARVQQIAWNLLSNAVKFTPAGGRVDALLAAAGQEVALTVEDTGAGIPSDFLPHVFERFRQADGSDARRHGGLGLGLALTRELVALHGGTIEAASAGAGRGATFRVVLPQAPRPASAAAPPARVERPRLGAARILVVDDEADSRELLLQLLLSWGGRPVGVASAREALEALDLAGPERPELLVSDIAMPGEDGCALVQELRRRERARGDLPVPAVALTAFGRPEDRHRVLAAGFDAHVPKPVEPDALRAVLTGLLGRGPAAAPTVEGPPPRAEPAVRPGGGGADAVAAG
ncbi:hybrid sensor histidine kinase/response regulator [Anaeromyxobacter oryzisoli]|uniref:hybrid sensor histidine kinase/response regulator n=1 Tax=Anaeromyxobacter oryzisoli TaxID=2925408 RepID=UPI001F5A66ED|nr:ATP-binding protein [Anaeromyxobacter sp. SG63]